MLRQTYSLAAVLTGDFIGSRRNASALQHAMDVLQTVASDLPGDLNCSVIFDRYRGDGWQILLTEGRHGLRAALRIIAALQHANALPTRIALGFGQAALPPDNDLGAASGPAFVTAGDVLAAMDRNQRLAIPRIPDPAHAAYKALVLFLDSESRNWTRGQAEAMYEALRLQPQTQEEIASRLGVTRQAIQSRLSGTTLGAVEEALHAFETRMKDMFDTGQMP